MSKNTENDRPFVKEGGKKRSVHGQDDARQAANAEYLQIIEILRNGGVGVLKTDTLYGLVAAAEKRETVERVFTLKGRGPEKPVIVLIAHAGQLAHFNVAINRAMFAALDSLWPGPVSIILPVDDPNGAFAHLHRGTNTIAFRLPNVSSDTDLMRIVREMPLIAPSANPEGKEPAHTIPEARSYFGDSIDFYKDEDEAHGGPSTLVSLDKQGSIKVLRGTLPQ